MYHLQTSYHVQCTCQEDEDGNGELITMQHSHGIDDTAEVLVCPECNAKVLLSIHTTIKDN